MSALVAWTQYLASVSQQDAVQNKTHVLAHEREQKWRIVFLNAFASLTSSFLVAGEVMLFRIASRDWPSNLTQSLISCFPSNMLNMTTLTFSDDGQGTVLLAAGCYLCCFQWRKQWEDRDENRITPWKSEHRVTRFSSSRHVDEMCAELQGI